MISRIPQIGGLFGVVLQIVEFSPILSVVNRQLPIGRNDRSYTCRPVKPHARQAVVIFNKKRGAVFAGTLNTRQKAGALQAEIGVKSGTIQNCRRNVYCRSQRRG